MNEIVYVLTNEAMPWYVKIGRTSGTLEKRIKELSASTSIPLPFSCFYACIVKDSAFVEHQLHDAFDDIRVNPRREFFQIAPERVMAALRLAEIEDITPKDDIVENIEDRKSLEEARKRRAKFNFEMVGIPVGATLTFAKDETATARVLEDGNVEYNGQKVSLSDSAWRILGYKHQPQGTLYWMYEGETLDTRRRRMEFWE
jgi:hypothetical protein